jgi:hypothetical protein
MVRDELNIKYLPEYLILRYLRNEASPAERLIVERLKSKDINRENFQLIKDMFDNNEFRISDPKKADYNKFLDLVKKYHSPDPNLFLKIESVKPSVGQIWTTKAIPKLGPYEIEPVVFPKFVYILTPPQPFQLLDEEDYVQSAKDLYTMLVLPISTDTEFATHKDYIIPSGNNLLGTEFMIETWLETNAIVCNLEKYVGRLNELQIDELLNLYYFSNDMEYDETVYQKTLKGIFHDMDYGDIYEFQRLEEENIEYLNEPVNKLHEFLTGEEWNTELISDPQYAEAAVDENVLSPSQQIIQAEFVLFSDENFELKLVILDEGQLYIRFKSLFIEVEDDRLKKQGSIILKDKTSGEQLQLFENINLLKAIQYLHISKLLKNRLVEFSFFFDSKLYFLKNVDLRNVKPT